MNDRIYFSLIDNIFCNKNLPYFAAERRIDSIFSLFIEDILTYELKKPICLVSQEFPIKIQNNNQAKCVDFLCMSVGDDEVFFVELKTDINSMDSDQLEFYLQNADWMVNIENLKIKINSKGMLSDYRIKYFYLIDLLERSNLIKYEGYIRINKIKEDIIKFHNEGDKANRTRTIKKVLDLVTPLEKKVKVVCIAPNRAGIERYIPEGVKLVTFNQMVDVSVTHYQKEWEYLLSKLIKL